MIATSTAGPHRRPSAWKRASRWQRIVMALALVAPAVIVVAVLSWFSGAISTEQLVKVALGAGENPGVLTFAAMFMGSPVQWITGRSQVRVRKFLGIVFYGLAVNNFVMFIVERRANGEDGVLAEIAGSPLLFAGSIALALATPLVLTSSRWSQRALGMRRWRLLHRLTYVVAAALVLHVLLIPDIGPDTVLLLAGFACRVPAMRRRLEERGRRLGPASHQHHEVPAATPRLPVASSTR